MPCNKFSADLLQHIYIDTLIDFLGGGTGERVSLNFPHIKEKVIHVNCSE